MEYVEVARARTPRGEIVLRERRAPDRDDSPVALELRVNGVFVMDTFETGSEKALARAALARVEAPRSVLVGGLGLGFTTHEVLADKTVERVVVVEIEDDLVRWMRDGTVPHGPAYLADDRLTVVTADLGVVMAEAKPGSYDLVLVDIDNGPGQLVHEVNRDVYRPQFVQQVRDALRTGGAVAFWSAAESAPLQEALEKVFGNATAIPYEVTLQGRQERFWLYLSRR
jgi:spermidine synthase